jgi:hypothetical protein
MCEDNSQSISRFAENLCQSPRGIQNAFFLEKSPGFLGRVILYSRLLKVSQKLLQIRFAHDIDLSMGSTHCKET